MTTRPGPVFVSRSGHWGGGGSAVLALAHTHSCPLSHRHHPITLPLDHRYQAEMAAVTQAGYHAILSAPFYLNIISYS